MPDVPIHLFSRYRRVCSEPFRRSRLDRCHGSSDAWMEGALFSRKAVSSSPTDGHRRKREVVGALLLRAKRLLSGRIPDLAAIPRSLPRNEEAIRDRRISIVIWLHLGRIEKNEAAGFRRVNAFSSTGPDAETESDLMVTV